MPSVTRLTPKRSQTSWVAWLAVRFTAPNRIGGHRDVTSTACPGNRLYRHVPDIADRANRIAGRQKFQTLRPRSRYR